MFRRLRFLPRFVIVLSVISITVACSSDNSTDTPISPSPVGAIDVDDIAASASTGGTQGVRRSGAPPGSNGGPQVTVSGNQTIINGGTLGVTLAANAPFNTIYVFVAGRTLGVVGEFGGGIEGHYELRMPSAQTTTSVLLTFPQEIPLSEFELQFAVASPSGAVGAYAGLVTNVTEVGTGDVQVTLSWDVDSDVDLHVVAPGNDEVYYGRTLSSSGGELDLDSNAGCSIDGVRNENITWPIGRAPRGVYTVRVDYWSSCGVGRSNYTVRVNNGGSVQIVTGSFTGEGDSGGAGSGRTVATFERTTGPTAIVSEALSAVTGLSFTKTLKKSPRQQ
jgi:uncharacterized protein YfaP (DUF2135 family)